MARFAFVPGLSLSYLPRIRLAGSVSPIGFPVPASRWRDPFNQTSDPAFLSNRTALGENLPSFGDDDAEILHHFACRRFPLDHGTGLHCTHRACTGCDSEPARRAGAKARLSGQPAFAAGHARRPTSMAPFCGSWIAFSMPSCFARRPTPANLAARRSRFREPQRGLLLTEPACRATPEAAERLAGTTWRIKGCSPRSRRSLSTCLGRW